MRDLMLEKIASFQSQKSGWQFDEILSLGISIAPFRPLAGSSYLPTPKKPGFRRSIVNIQNKSDNKCITYTMAAAVSGTDKKNPQRLTTELKANAEKFDWTGIDFPTPLNQIDTIEKNTPDYALNVCSYDDERFSILCFCENPDGKKMIHMLHLKNQHTEHYAWIKNFNRLMRSEVTNHKSAHEFCYRCFSHFQTKEKQEEHLKDCSKFRAVRIVIRVNEDGTPQYVSFNHKKLNRKMQFPIIVYADFECINRMIDTCQPNPDKSYTQRYQ